MTCPLCRDRPPRRLCPALGRDICPVCCGTKRQVEIRCPADCRYLAGARTHPPAVVKKQQERDFGYIAASFGRLSQSQGQLSWLLFAAIAGFQGDALLRATDEDLAEAAGALAATYETAGRGVIYEHRPNSLVAQRLATDIQTLLQKLGENGGRAFERDAATVLRALEKAATGAQKALGDGPTSCLELVKRLVRDAGLQDRAPEAAPPEPPGPTLVLP
jgi:hypothetical protein